ncbi:major facilitator superfamily protein [Sarocladium implicatum]|nr:major facilitator superfamily protein [Sarocladium implicatum]
MSDNAYKRDPEAVLPAQTATDQATATTPLLASSTQEATYASTSSSALQAPEPSHDTVTARPSSSATVLKVVSVLIIGAFTANVDGSLVLATHPTISSEFNALSASNWLFVSFILAGAATQAVSGKLSDIYGRRALIIAAYALFATGCAVVGVGTSMGQVILGRVISGAGGSSLTVLAMLIITDLVPIREAAAWQSYLNLASTTGRSLGGPLGGWLADTIGWRWSFLSQVPVFLIAILLTYTYIPGKKSDEAQDVGSKKSASLSRIDFPGAILLALTVVTVLLPFEIGGSNVSWSHPLIPILFVGSVLFGAVFVRVEGWWAKEPIFPLELLRIPNVVLGYIVSGSQAAAQLGLMFSVPLYFQVTTRASNTVAGAYLFPAVAGNAIGSILAAVVIKRTGSYKLVLTLATVTSASSYLLLLLRWHGHTSVWEALYIFPGGFGTGAVQTGVFVAVQAATDPAHKAAALGGIWLIGMVGSIMGMTAVSAATMQSMGWSLSAALRSQGLAENTIEKIVDMAASDINYLDKADPIVSSAVVEAYVQGLSVSHVVNLGFSVIAITAALFIRQRKI